MAETINARNIGDYLAHLAQKLHQPLPAPYHNATAFTAKSGDEIAAALEDLYARLGIPNQTGWSFEDAFLKEAPKVPLPENLSAAAYQNPLASSFPTSYLPVASGIGRANFRPFLYWVEDRLKRSLDLSGIAAWDNFSNEGVRNALPGIYEAAGILPDDAKQLELGFLAVYHQKVAPVPVIAATPVRSAAPAASLPKAVPAATTILQAKPRRKRRFSIPIIIGLFAAGLVGFWLWQKYAAYLKQPLVYALTNNIALRKDASDTAPIAGRMDIYGQYMDGNGVRHTSPNSLKLSTEELTNNFYTASTGTSFWSYLTGNDSTVYVHTKYVTTDKALFDKYTDDLSALKNDYNELDKLGFIYRQMIGRAVLKNSEGTAIKIAASCRPAAKLSRIAPLSIGKYRNRATGELDVFFQATDGFCYVLRGGENELPPTITPVVIQYGLMSEPMKSGGMLTKQGNNGGLRFEYCTEGQVFFSQPPYTLFLPLPAPIQAPSDPVEPDDNPAVPVDTAAVTF